MTTDTTHATKLSAGRIIPFRTWKDAQGNEVQLPNAKRWTHLQFRRYSGCAVCNLHLQEFITRQHALLDANIQEVIIFNSTRERILEDLPGCPFPIIADQHKYLYQEFGVGASRLAVLYPSVWLPALRGAVNFGVQLPRDQETMNGLPADFLIDCQGKIIAAHYGKHAYDQWSLDTVLALADSTPIQNEKENVTA